MKYTCWILKFWKSNFDFSSNILKIFVFEKRLALKMSQAENDAGILPSPSCSCPICKSFDNSRMVQCDDCSLWYHFECVGVTQEVENHDWSCDVCQAAKFRSDPSTHRPIATHSKLTVGPSTTQSQPQEPAK